MSDSDGLVAVAVTGDRRRILEAMRDRAAAELDANPPPHAVAPLLRELSNILAALDSLPKQEGVSFLDDLQRRRADRVAAAQTP